MLSFVLTNFFKHYLQLALALEIHVHFLNSFLHLHLYILIQKYSNQICLVEHNYLFFIFILHWPKPWMDDLKAVYSCYVEHFSFGILITLPLLYSFSPFVLEVIFHERVRVLYQGFQTRENNGIHEVVYQAVFIVLENL